MLHGGWYAQTVTVRLPGEASARRERQIREATRILKEERARKRRCRPLDVRLGDVPGPQPAQSRAPFFA